jgi:hypothetical protein
VPCEATEDQYCLGRDGIDDFTNLFVVKHQIDELRDLDVVDSDLGLVSGGDDQVLLLGPFQF